MAKKLTLVAGYIPCYTCNVIFVIHAVQTHCVKLTTHHRMLAALRDLTDLSTRQLCEQRHAELDTMTQALQHDAELEQRRLRKIMSQWEEFVGVFASEHDWLSQLVSQQQQAMAVIMSDTSTLRELHQISDEYRDIQQAVASRTFSVTQVGIDTFASLLPA